MVILGINSAYHEPAAAVVIDGQLIAAAEEERFTRVKHGKKAEPGTADELPWNAINSCLDRGGVNFGDVNAIGYSMDPWLRRRVRWPDEHSAMPGDFGTRDGEEAFFRSQLKARAALLERMPNGSFHFLSHHLCHAASAYLTSPYDEAAILVLDGIGESASVLAAFGRKGDISPTFVVEYPHSLGFLWERTCEFLGFDRYDGPGKVMALGTQYPTIGEETGIDYLERFSSFVHTCAGGLFEINPEVLLYRERGFGGLERVFGSRDLIRVPGERGALAAGLQKITETVVVHLACELWKRVNQNRMEPVDAVCLAGGVALNCVANAVLARQSPWRKVWIQPAAHDAGTALGAALLVGRQILGHSGRVQFDTAYWGPEYSDQECVCALAAKGLSYRTVPDLPYKAAQMVAQGKVIGWFQGRMEFGPRALGNRSILADPRRPEMRTILNQKIKEREHFRPFAPTIIAEDISLYLALSKQEGDSLHGLEYMALAVPAMASAAENLPAAINCNLSGNEATARVHALVSGRNPLYEEFLAAFKRETGVSAVLNTSLNVKEPIACTPADACRTFVESGLDALVLGSYLVERP